MSSLPKTSRAAVLTQDEQPLEIREMPVPDLEPMALTTR
jgi:hypothetical protein